jgi:hypothetical protein
VVNLLLGNQAVANFSLAGFKDGGFNAIAAFHAII